MTRSPVTTRLEQFLPAAERRYTRAGRALYDWIREGVSRLPLDSFGSDGAELRSSVDRAVRELTTNYYRARSMWAGGTPTQKIAAAQLMADSAVIAVRLEQDIRRHERRIPVIARWLANATVQRVTRSLRQAANEAAAPLRELGRGFGMGAGMALGIGLLALYALKKS